AAARGLHPRTPTYFSLVARVGKSTHRRGTLSTVSPSSEPPPATTNEGAAAPALDYHPAPPALSSGSAVAQDIGRLCGGFQRGARAPLCVVAGVGSIGEGPQRKGPSVMRPFAYFSGEGKVGRGTGAEPPKFSGHGAGGPE